MMSDEADDCDEEAENDNDFMKEDIDDNAYDEEDDEDED